MGFLDHQLEWKYSENKTEEKKKKLKTTSSDNVETSSKKKVGSNVVRIFRRSQTSDRDVEAGVDLLPTEDPAKIEIGKKSPEAVQDVQNKEAIQASHDSQI